MSSTGTVSLPIQPSTPICAPATPLFPSAVALVRVSGVGLAKVLEPLLAFPSPRVASLRTLAWNGFQERALVLYFPAPSSYTGEDVVEFQIHGNPLLVRRLLDFLGSLGIRLAQPGEFTRRALLNGKQDLLSTEALRDLMAAETDAQIRLAQARAGAQPSWIAQARLRLIPWMAQAEAAVDYGEDDGITLNLKDLQGDLTPLLASFHVEQARARAAQRLQNGIRLALVGRPNAGKSTLFNTLVGEDRAIVTDIPGTTRDVLEVCCEWRGLPLRIFDTAGLRDTDHPIERLGMARVTAVLEAADLVLHLIPVGDPPEDAALDSALAPFHGKVQVLGTFGDLGSGEGPTISAQTGDLQALEFVLRERVLGGLAPDACLGAISTARQVELLDELVRQLDFLGKLPEESPCELTASLLQGAWGLLARLTGEDRADSCLDEVFRGFCLGK